MLPTPSATSYGSNQGGAAGRVGPVRHSLESMARHGLWPTPTSLSPAKNGNNEAGNSCGLVAIRKRILDETPQATGSLSPLWVAWLMGYPTEWLSLEPSAMPSSRKSRKWSAAPFFNSRECVAFPRVKNKQVSSAHV
jgi:hypothetical protein